LLKLRCAFGAISLGEEHARLFNLPAGFPMLHVRYTPFGQADTPLLLGTTIARSDRFSFEVDLPQHTTA
jgi:DNA-binding GntR family transcriptional regulator